MRNARVLAIAVVAAVCAALPIGPALAEPVLVSELTFDPANPTYDPYGSGTSILEDVTVTEQGWLDFFGRSVVETPDRPSLNPGTADFAFGVRLALTRGVGNWNVMQKGYWNDQQWKLSLHDAGSSAQVSCRVSGSNGAVHVFTDGAVLPADGTWHQVGCARIGSEVQVRLDGVVVATGSGPIGSVSSTQPYLVGSKGIGAISDPDQYAGLLDDAYVEVDTASGGGEPSPPLSATTTATVETEPVLHSGDAADDPAIWPHPTDPAQSLVIGNDKGGALDVYDMNGALVQRIEEGFFGNVDVRTGVTVGGQTRDIAAVYRAGLRLYAIDPDTRRLVNVTDSSTGSLAVPTGGEGVCLYRSPETATTYAFVVSRAGAVAQYQLTDADGDGLVDATRVRLWSLSSEAEGCVADDALGRFYVSEEDVALWRYGAEPTDGMETSDRVAVDRVTSAGGRLAPDIEGLTLVDTGPGAGYLMASAQAGSDTANYFAVYDRAGSNDFVRTFSVVTGSTVDGCARTDGIAAWAGDLGPSFPHGVFVCQDNVNTTPGSSGNQNFKLVPLERVVALGPVENQPPAAVLATPSCDGLTCSFDATGSTDPEGSALAFTWELGDGTVAETPTVTHTYPASGSYTVTVEVRDTDGAAALASAVVDVADTPAAIEFRGAAGAATNATAISPRVPADVQAGDGMLLIVSANRSGITLGAPPGWQLIGQRTDDSMLTAVWSRVAQVGDASSLVRVTTGQTTKMTAQIVAYSGSDPVQPVAGVASAAATSQSTSQRTPIIAASPTDWAVSVWASKSSSTTGWTAPAAVAVRDQRVNSGSGRIASLVADSAGPVGSTSTGGLVAVASQASSTATTWTIVLSAG